MDATLVDIDLLEENPVSVVYNVAMGYTVSCNIDSVNRGQGRS